MVVPALVTQSAQGTSRAQARAADPVAVENIRGTDRLEQLLFAIERLRDRRSTSLTGTTLIAANDQSIIMDTGSQTAEALLLEPAVYQVISAMVEARRAAESGELDVRSRSISTSAVFKLGHALGSARRSMLDDLTAGDIRIYSSYGAARAGPSAAGQVAGPKPTFAAVLATYYKALANGEFIDRRGQQLAKLKYSDGIGNETLGELVTVFFEALCDHALYEELPLFYKQGEQSVVLTPMYAPILVNKDSAGIEHFAVDTNNAHVVDIGEPSDHRPDNLVQAYVARSVRSADNEYLLTEGKTPTAVAAKIVREIDINDPSQNTDAITERQLKAVRTISNFVGQRAEGAGGLVFGFLGKIDISFVLGAGFSVGDNKTLQELVTAIAEVASRRTAEWAAYSVAKKYNESHRSANSTTVLGASQSTPFWERLEALPGAND